MNKKHYSGLTPDVAENIQMNSGAIFVNYDLDTDDYDSAVAAGKLIGATRGEMSFSVVPTYRQIEVNGVLTKVKGLQVIDSVEIKLSGSILTLTTDVLAKALGIADIDTTSDEFYDIITSSNYLEDSNYLDNITLVGKILGTQNPITIQLKNALNMSGLVVQLADKAEAVVPVDFMAHIDPSDLANLDEWPYVIKRPKAEGTVTGVVTDGTDPVDAATVTITIDTTDYTTTTDATGAYTLTGIPYGTRTVTATKAALTGTASAAVVGGKSVTVGITVA